MATAPPALDVAGLYERVLQATDDADSLIVELAGDPPSRLVSLRVQLAAIEEQLQDVLDLQTTQDGLADAREHGAILWSQFEAQLDAER